LNVIQGQKRRKRWQNHSEVSTDDSDQSFEEETTKKRHCFSLEDDVTILTAIKQFKRRNGNFKRIKWSDVQHEDPKLLCFTPNQVRGRFKNLIKNFDNDIEQTLKDVQQKLKRTNRNKTDS
jgi:hypothetical protein